MVDFRGMFSFDGVIFWIYMCVGAVFLPPVDFVVVGTCGVVVDCIRSMVRRTTVF